MQDGFEASKMRGPRNFDNLSIDEINTLIRLTVNLYASKEICKILAAYFATISFQMQSFIYINQYIEMY